MDNLYISAKFAKAAWMHKKRVLIAGVARKQGRGVPLCVVQEEVKKISEQHKCRGRTKAAVLMGDKDMPQLLAVSVYDTKPVHFLSTIEESIEWVPKTRQVWNESKQRKTGLQFLRLNINDSYNQDMNAVDIADQLRGNYRFDHWMRNYKWWWSIFNWGYGVLLVNAYTTYKSVMDLNGVPINQRLTHYQFRLAVARVMIDVDGDKRIKDWKSRHQQESIRLSGNKRHRQQETPLSPAPPAGTRPAKAARTGPSPIVLLDSPKPKSPQLSDASLAPTGKLKCRLNFYDFRHLPVTKESAGKPFAKCSLHRWACGRDGEVRGGISICEDCNVSLCVDCYKVFHTQEDLTSVKEELKEGLEAKVTAAAAAKALKRSPLKGIKTPPANSRKGKGRSKTMH